MKPKLGELVLSDYGELGYILIVRTQYNIYDDEEIVYDVEWMNEEDDLFPESTIGTYTEESINEFKDNLRKFMTNEFISSKIYYL